MRAPKSDLPLSADSDVQALVSRFESCTLPYQHWTHQAHLAVAVAYASRYPFITALNRMREHINAYNQQCGQPDGYNETVTVLFLRKVFTASHTELSGLSLPQKIAHMTTLCTVEWIYRYYSRDLIWSAAARHQFQPPDITPLDF